MGSLLNQIVANSLPFFPKKFIWLFSKRYVAGEQIEDGLRISQQLNEKGIWVTVDLLGEFTHAMDQAEATKNNYLEIIDRFEQLGIRGNYSLKPTSFGLLLDKEKCYGLVRQVIAKAASIHNFVRIDMEDSKCTDLELELFTRLHNEFPNNVGLVLQAYLHRTYSDIETLVKQTASNNSPLNIRLCKGIYVESEEIAFKDPQEIRYHYLKDLELMLKNGVYSAIATHDNYLVDEAVKLLQQYNVADNRCEFQMLYGVTPGLRDTIVQAGHKMRLYVPFGHDWFGYCSRRIKENPKMANDILKALFVRG